MKREGDPADDRTEGPAARAELADAVEAGPFGPRRRRATRPTQHLRSGAAPRDPELTGKEIADRIERSGFSW